VFQLLLLFDFVAIVLQLHFQIINFDGVLGVVVGIDFASLLLDQLIFLFLKFIDFLMILFLHFVY